MTATSFLTAALLFKAEPKRAIRQELTTAFRRQVRRNPVGRLVGGYITHPQSVAEYIWRFNFLKTLPRADRFGAPGGESNNAERYPSPVTDATTQAAGIESLQVTGWGGNEAPCSRCAAPNVRYFDQHAGCEAFWANFGSSGPLALNNRSAINPDLRQIIPASSKNTNIFPSSEPYTGDGEVRIDASSLTVWIHHPSLARGICC